MTLLNDLSMISKNPGHHEEHEQHRRGNPKEPDRRRSKARPKRQRRKEPFDASVIGPCIAVCAAALAFGLFFFPWIGEHSGWDAADAFERSAEGATSRSSLGIAKYSMLISTPCSMLAGLIAIDRKTSFAAPLFMFMGTSAAALFSIPAVIAVSSATKFSLFSGEDPGKEVLATLTPIGVPLFLTISACAAGFELERRSENLRTQIDDLRRELDSLYTDDDSCPEGDNDLHSEDDDLYPDIERRIKELHSLIQNLELKAGVQRPDDARQTQGDGVESRQQPNALSNSGQPSDESSDSPQTRRESSETEGTGK